MILGISSWSPCRRVRHESPHEPLIRMLREKVTDERFVRLIIRLLKAPILGAEGGARLSERGSPQGSILCPRLANVYPHRVLGIWFENLNRRPSDFGIAIHEGKTRCPPAGTKEAYLHEWKGKRLAPVMFLAQATHY